MLLFDPIAGYIGTANFTYTATDNSGAGSSNTATYAMPIDSRPLPVELVSFSAKVVRVVDVQLIWRTATELNNDHFEVQRSANGRQFESIARVAGHGTSNTATDYAYTDGGIGATMADQLYYRLRQVDHDGTSSFSPVQIVQFGKISPPAISLFPNPATTTSLDLSLLPAGTYQVRVLDAMGRQILATTREGGTTLPLDIRAAANGTYLVLVRGTDGQLFTKRLVKE